MINKPGSGVGEASNSSCGALWRILGSSVADAQEPYSSLDAYSGGLWMPTVIARAFLPAYMYVSIHYNTRSDVENVA